MLDGGEHAACVDAWLGRFGRDPAPALLLRLFEAALGAVWTRSKTTLGEVTLTAIADRVLHSASEKFPVLSSLRVEETTGIDWRDPHPWPKSTPPAEVIAGLRFVIVEFVTVLGHLTAEILTPDLHAEISRVALPDAVSFENEDNTP